MKPRNRELATLGLCSVIKILYILYAYRGFTIKLGFTAEQADAAAGGIVPQGLNDEEAMAYKLGRFLTTLAGPLDDVTFPGSGRKAGKERGDRYHTHRRRIQVGSFTSPSQ